MLLHRVVADLLQSHTLPIRALGRVVIRSKFSASTSGGRAALGFGVFAVGEVLGLLELALLAHKDKRLDDGFDAADANHGASNGDEATDVLGAELVEGDPRVGVVDEVDVDSGWAGHLRRRRVDLKAGQFLPSHGGVEHHLVHRRAEAGKSLDGSHLDRGEEVGYVSARLERGVVQLERHLALGVHPDAPHELEADLAAEESGERRHELGATVILREPELGEVYAPARRRVGRRGRGLGRRGLGRLLRRRTSTPTPPSPSEPASTAEPAPAGHLK